MTKKLRDLDADTKMQDQAFDGRQTAQAMDTEVVTAETPPEAPTPPELFLGYEQHDAATLYDLMEGEEFDKFCDALAKIGLASPIVLHEGKVLEGRNRCRAIARLRSEGREIEPAFVEWVPKADETPHDYVLAVNGPRRHQTTDQRVITAYRFLPILREQSRQRQESSRFQAGKGTDDAMVAKTSQPPRQRSSKLKNENSTAGQLAKKCFISLHMANQVIELDKTIQEGKLQATVIEEVVKGAKLSKVLTRIRPTRTAGSGSRSTEQAVRGDVAVESPVIQSNESAGTPFDPSCLWGKPLPPTPTEGSTQQAAATQTSASTADDDFDAEVVRKFDQSWQRFLRSYAVTEYERVRELAIGVIRSQSHGQRTQTNHGRSMRKPK